ncbi:Gamma thionin [Artemisia annua]|uniref:Gamma thionin n=1 Tax=Artemisia annua TaxID=35608 RepID=A0A2U1PD00_ARTAN|nr:Gamma thionin [Artemisia annua]
MQFFDMKHQQHLGSSCLISVETGVKVTEAKMCRTTGHMASCVNDRTCTSSCEKQGFTSGSCDGIRRR